MNTSRFAPKPTLAVSLEMLAYDLEQFKAKPSDVSAEEALGFIIKTFDVIRRTVSNVRVSIFKAFSDFKQSELQVFDHSRPLAIRSLLKQTTFPLDNILVPIPLGMKVPYHQAAITLSGWATKIDLGKVSTQLVTYFDQVLMDARKNSTQHLTVPELNSLEKSISVYQHKDVEAVLRSLFNADGPDEVKAGSVFMKFADFKDTYAHLLTVYPPIFHKTVGLAKTLDTVDARINQLVVELRRAPPGVGVLDALYRTVMTAAQQYDLYAAIVHEMQRVEHNFALVANKLVRIHADA